jgi:hypothetical protein
VLLAARARPDWRAEGFDIGRYPDVASGVPAGDHSAGWRPGSKPAAAKSLSRKVSARNLDVLTNSARILAPAVNQQPFKPTGRKREVTTYATRQSG